MKAIYVCFVPDNSVESSHIQWICDNGKIYNSDNHYLWVVFHPLQFKKMIKCLTEHIKRNEYINKNKLNNWVNISTNKTTRIGYDFNLI